MNKSLDAKLAEIRANPNSRAFILADAKDADMAFGIASPGKSPEHYAAEGKFRSLPEFHECIRQIVRQGLVDIMLMSAHANDLLTIKERLSGRGRAVCKSVQQFANEVGAEKYRRQAPGPVAVISPNPVQPVFDPNLKADSTGNPPPTPPSQTRTDRAGRTGSPTRSSP